jgi:hypothetical protein
MKIIIIYVLGFFAGRWLGIRRLIFGVMGVLALFYFKFICENISSPLSGIIVKPLNELKTSSEFIPNFGSYIVPIAIVSVLFCLAVWGIESLMARFFYSKARQGWGGGLLGAIINYSFYMTIEGWIVLVISFGVIVFGFLGDYFLNVPKITWQMLSKYRQYFKWRKIKHIRRRKNESPRLQESAKPPGIQGSNGRKFVSGSGRAGRRRNNRIKRGSELHGGSLSQNKRKNHHSKRGSRSKKRQSG